MNSMTIKREPTDHSSYGYIEDKMDIGHKTALLTGIKHEHGMTEPCYSSIEQLFACRHDRYIFCEFFQSPSDGRSRYRRFTERLNYPIMKKEHQMAETFAELEDFTEVVIDGTTPTPRKRRNGGAVKRGGRTGGSPYTTVPLPPCKVCSGVATGYHFGVITCEACKAFFRRALIHKHNYKCLKDDNCQITDKKLGNCSACRLRKCFELGMSKGGVRRGRYSIAIRTQAILEAKAREADIMTPAPKKQRLDETVVQEMNGSDVTGIAFDVFDGLLDIADFNGDFKLPGDEEQMSFTESSPPMYNQDDTVAVVPTVYVEQDSSDSGFEEATQTFYQVKAEPVTWQTKQEPIYDVKPEPLTPSSPLTPPDSPVFKENRQLEFLIDAVMSCQDAVYPNLKKRYNLSVQQEQYKIFEELRMKEQVFDGLFGTEEKTLSTAEFQQIFAETGLDLDDRLACFNKKGKSMEETIAQYVNFAKLVPGFKSLNPKDVAKMLKAAHFEFWMLGNYMMFNSEYGVSSSWDGTHKSTKKDMLKFFDQDIVDGCFEHSDRLKALHLSLEEIALVRLIVLTYTDRCPLIDVSKIQTLQEKFVECLSYHLSKTVPNPGKRLSQIFNNLLTMRDITHVNVSANKKFLQEWDFLMHDYPLWKEMLSYDGES